MTIVKSLIKRIPVINGLAAQLHKLFRKKQPAVQGLLNIINNRGVLNKVVFDVIGNHNHIDIGNNSTVKNTLVYIRGNNHRVIIKDNCSIGGGEIWIEDENCALIIHEHTTIEHAHLAITEPSSILEIHKDCMLARHVEIRTGDSHSIIDNETGKRINKAANVTLMDHVWIGAHVKILKGVTIGNNSVIGTASVVTKNIPAHCIAVGMPAKIIRQGITWDRKRIAD